MMSKDETHMEMQAKWQKKSVKTEFLRDRELKPK